MGNCCSGESASTVHDRATYERQRTQSGAGAARKAPSFTLNRQEGTPSSKLRTDAKVRDVYKLGRTLGTGGFSVVKLAEEKATGTVFACKIMALPLLGSRTADGESTREDIFKEIEILVGLNNVNVVYLKEYFQENEKVYLIMELLTGGELLDAVLEKGSYSEADARLCFIQLLRGVAYLHSQGVAHRDLKLENLLLASPDDITDIKVADFGLAEKTLPGGTMKTICGTPQYVAPEIIQQGPGVTYTHIADMWSCGVILYVLLGGYPPFYDEHEPTLFKLIRNGQLRFDDPVWTAVSDSAKDLISKLLVVDPSKRLTAEAALRHPWIDAPLQNDASLHLTQVNMRRTLRKRKFKGAVHTVIAQNRLMAVQREVSAGNLPTHTLIPENGEGMKLASAAAARLQQNSQLAPQQG